MASTRAAIRVLQRDRRDNGDLVLAVGADLFACPTTDHRFTRFASLPQGRVVSAVAQAADASGRFFVAAHNEIFFVRCRRRAEEAIASSADFCCRLDDRVLHLLYRDGGDKASALCLGCTGIVVEVSSEGAVRSIIATPAASGLSTSGFLCAISRRCVVAALGTYFGAVVLSRFDPDDPPAAVSAATPLTVKCHGAGIVASVSTPLLLPTTQEQPAERQLVFATGGDERRAVVVHVRLRLDGAFDGPDAAAVRQLPLESGRVRSVALWSTPAAAAAQGGGGVLRCATSGDDGALRVYAVGAQPAAQLLAHREGAHGVGWNGGALQCLAVPECDALLTAGADGKLGFWGASTLADLSVAAASRATVTLRSAATGARDRDGDDDDGGDNDNNNNNEDGKGNLRSLRSVCVVAPGAFACVAADWSVTLFSADASRKPSGPFKLGAPPKKPRDAQQMQDPSCIAVAHLRCEAGLFAVAVGGTDGAVQVATVQLPCDGESAAVELRSACCEYKHDTPNDCTAVTSVRVVVSTTAAESAFSVVSSTAFGSVARAEVRDGVFCGVRCGSLPSGGGSPHVLASGARLIACHRSGVYEMLPQALDGAPMQAHLLSRAQDAFSGPRRMAMWALAALFFNDDEKAEGDPVHPLSMQLVHSNRFFQVLELPTQIGSATARSSSPRPMCPDLSLRDILAASPRHAVVAKSSGEIVLWDRSKNCAVISSASLPQPQHVRFDPTRMRSAAIFEERKCASVVWWRRGNPVHCVTFDWSSSSDDAEAQPQRSEFECGSHDFNCAVSLGGGMIATGSDEEIALWRRDPLTQQTFLASRLAFHTASVLGLAAAPRGDLFVSVGSSASIAFWTKTTCAEWVLQYSEQPPSGTASVQELERFLCCDVAAHQGGRRVVAVGSSCGDVLLFSWTAASSGAGLALQDHTVCAASLHRRRLPVAKQSRPDAARRPVFCVAAECGDAAVVVVSGTGHGSALFVTSLNSVAGGGDADVVECEVPFPGSTSRGAVTALKLLAHDAGRRLCVAANEGGDVVVWQRELLPVGFSPVFAASLCNTTPRCILDDGSPNCHCVAVVEEGRRLVVVDFSSSPATVREQFVSVSRLRGAARIAGSVVVAGQGLQVL